jgi:hypothetical protein
MDEGAENHGGAIPSRHPLAALPFGAMLTFVGGRARREPETAGPTAAPVVERAPVVADRTGILALGAFGAGALVGSLLFGAVGRGWPRRLTFLTCWVLGPLGMVVNWSLHQMDAGRR